MLQLFHKYLFLLLKDIYGHKILLYSLTHDEGSFQYVHYQNKIVGRHRYHRYDLQEPTWVLNVNTCTSSVPLQADESMS